jgi:hypothetical protein
VLKTTPTAGAKICISPVIWNHLVSSFDHAGINGGCNSGFNSQSQEGLNRMEKILYIFTQHDEINNSQEHSQKTIQKKKKENFIFLYLKFCCVLFLVFFRKTTYQQLYIKSNIIYWRRKCSMFNFQCKIWSFISNLFLRQW